VSAFGHCQQAVKNPFRKILQAMRGPKPISAREAFARDEVALPPRPAANDAAVAELTPPRTPTHDPQGHVAARAQYARHFDLLMTDLFHQGVSPEQCQILAMREISLDEKGMTVEFRLALNDGEHTFQVTVCRGALVGIAEV
jgi:hypothetical protein